tara:strand:+ start:882 stop:1085 length:204 start_codon:yes stop_codon:yes gene_type:complete
MSYALEVTVHNGEGELDRALKRLKTKVDNEGILDEVRRRRTFMNKTEIRKWKLKLAHKKAKQAKNYR